MATQGSGAELMELVTQMKGTIQEHFLPTMQGLHDKLDSELSHVADWLADINNAVKEAEPAFNDAFQTTQHKIEEMEGIVKQEVAETAQTIQTYVGHLHDAKGHAQELLNNAVTHATDVTEKLHQADDTHGTAGDAITHILGEWTNHTTEHLATLETHHQSIVEALHTYNDHANTHVTDMTAKLQHTGEFVTEHVQTLVQQHVTNAGELLNQQKDHFVHVVGEALGGHVGEVIGGVQGFVHTGEQLGSAFDGGLGDVLQKVDEVSKLIEEIKPIIDLAKKLS